MDGRAKFDLLRARLSNVIRHGLTTPIGAITD